MPRDEVRVTGRNHIMKDLMCQNKEHCYLKSNLFQDHIADERQTSISIPV